MIQQRVVRSDAHIPAGRAWLVIVGLLACLACSRDTSPDAFTTVDSAGVRIASSAEPRLGERAWRVDSAPVVDIGGADSDTAVIITEVAGGFLFDDGGFVIADADDRMLRFFDARGVSTRNVGRKGGGPGEYQEVYGIRPATDSVVVFDGDLERVTLLGRGGDYGRSFTVTGTPVGSRVGGRWSDGRFMFTNASGVSSDMPIHALRDTLAVLRVSSQGTLDSALGKWPGRETIAATSPRFVSSIESPYGKRSTIRFHPQGFVVGTADAAQIDRYDINAKLTMSVRWSAASVPVAASELGEWRSTYHDQFRGAPSQFSEAFRRAVEIAEFPAVRPPYRTFHVTLDDELWVQRVAKWNADAAPSTWDVFDSTGEWLSSLELPASAELLDIRGDRLLMRWEDAEGVPHIRVYQIRRDNQETLLRPGTGRYGRAHG